MTLTSSGFRSLKTVSFSPFRLDGFKAYQETVCLFYLTAYFEFVCIFVVNKF